MAKQPLQQNDKPDRLAIYRLIISTASLALAAVKFLYTLAK